jgi:FkbH-like protein
MIESIEPYLRFSAYKMGYNAMVLFGEYDNIFQEAVGGNTKLLNKSTDCVLVYMYLETISWDLARNFPGLSTKQIQVEIQRIQENVESIIEGIRCQTAAMILWHGFEIPANPNFGVWDSQLSNGQAALVQDLNSFIRSVCRKFSNVYFVDVNLCMSRLGIKDFYDTRYWHIGKAPYTRLAMHEIALEDFKYIRPLKGRNKKCLVLDCDNTLWGGIVGDDGLTGIMLGKTYPGSAYYEFQQEILNLYNRGIIIALCSKNNEEDVWDVFRNHPDMILSENQIAVSQINWRDKVANIRQIALDLNIGLDSIVFVDDSKFEVNLILQELPEVETILLPEGRPTEYRKLLASCGWFDTLTISDEDKKRGAMYKAEISRNKLKAQNTDLESYYKSLDMIVNIHFADAFTISRIAQQTQKTNQFNLTTRRYSEADVKSYVESDDYDVIYLKLEDRFGDSGTVGTCIMKYENEKAIFDTFLLSCRVLGRGLEDVFIIHAMKLAKERGCKLAVGKYFATQKNKQVEYFYRKQGYQEVNPINEKADRVFHFPLDKEIKKEPRYFCRINSIIE